MPGKRKKIVYVLGTRPEIIRSASIIKALGSDPAVDFRLVHTGQHYDYFMNEVFMKELGLPRPHANLDVGSGSHAEQTAWMMVRFEEFLYKVKPDMVAVFGDTNSSLAVALASVKLDVPLAHLEAGCREWEMDMPEEVNRRLIDHCSNLLLTVSEVCSRNLREENVLGEIFNIGDPLFEVFRREMKEARKMNLGKELGLEKRDYILLTTHRAKNVDYSGNLKEIITALGSIRDVIVVFPVHPRTKKNLDRLKLSGRMMRNFKLIEPLSYRETLNLTTGARVVVTDSGGLQKEAFWCKVPCITLRNMTAWVETVDMGVNFLAGIDKEKITSKIAEIFNRYDELKLRFSTLPNPYYKRNTSQRAVALLKEFADKRWENWTSATR